MGKDLTKVFTLKFLGPVGTAKLRAQKTHAAQRSPDGKWGETFANLPDDVKCRVFIDFDKSRKTQLTEMLLKHTIRKIKESVPAPLKNDFWIKKADNAIYSKGWVPLARVSVHAERDFAIDWNIPSAKSFDLDIDDIRTYAMSCIKSPMDKVQWG